MSQQLPPQPQRQQQQSGRNRRDRNNERHNEAKQQCDGGHADSFHRQVPTTSSQGATDKHMGQQGQHAPARTTSDDAGHLSQLQGGNGIKISANKHTSTQQTASSNIPNHTQAAAGFISQHGRGRVSRAPPGLQQGVNNHWRRSDRVISGLPPGLQHGTTGQENGSVGASPKLPLGLPAGANSRTAR